MKVAALVFLGLYLLVGVRSVFWYQSYSRVRGDMKADLPWWGYMVVLALVLLDVILWPINAIGNR